MLEKLENVMKKQYFDKKLSSLKAFKSFIS